MKPGDVVVKLIREKNGRMYDDGSGWWVVKEVFRPKPILGAPPREGYVMLVGFGRGAEHIKVFVSPKQVRRVPAKILDKYLLSRKTSSRK